MNKQTIVALTGLLLVVAFAAGSSTFKTKEAERIGFLAMENASTLAPLHAQTLGPADARVYIVEFFDPACETCAMFYGPVKEIMAAHPDRIRLVLRYAPFHPGSEVMVKILEASRKQGRYWETLEIMFASQQVWASHADPQPDRIWQFLPRAGVDIAQLRVDMQDPELDALIQQDMADAATLGVRKTPGFLVNGKPLTSFGLAQLQALVESEVAANY